METKKSYTPVKIELECLEMDVMSVSQQFVDDDPYVNDIYSKQVNGRKENGTNKK